MARVHTGEIWCAEKRQPSPSGIVRRDSALPRSPETQSMRQDQSHSRPRHAWRAGGLKGLHHREAAAARRPKFNTPPQQPSSLKWQIIIFFFLSVFGIVYASQMSCKGNFGHSTNFCFQEAAWRKERHPIKQRPLRFFIQPDEQRPKMAGD